MVEVCEEGEEEEGEEEEEEEEGEVAIIKHVILALFLRYLYRFGSKCVGLHE